MLHDCIDFRSPKVAEETDNDCDMPEVNRQDDDTDIESFEREEKRMEEEAAKVRSMLLIWLDFPLLTFHAAGKQGAGKNLVMFTVVTVAIFLL